jgi:hypothetical protein
MGIKRRQVTIGNYGRADLITLERPIKGVTDTDFPVLTIFELKQNKINNGTIIQVVRYARGVQRYLEDKCFCDGMFQVRVVCIGNEIDKNKSDLIYLVPLLSEHHKSFCLIGVSVYTYDYKFDGIVFDSIPEWALTNEGF